MTSPVSRPLAPHTDVRGMFDRIAERYDTANRVMSAGVDKRWRKAALAPLLHTAGDSPCILDLGAGTLDGALEIVHKATGARVAAADFSKRMLHMGSRKLGALSARIAPHAADGHFLPYRGQAFDGVFTAFCVRNLANRPVAFTELRRVLKPGGSLVVLEFFRPERTRWFFDKFYNRHVLPLVGWAISGDKAAYQYLPNSIAAFATRTQVEQELRDVGFSQVTGRDLFPAGVASLVVAR